MKLVPALKALIMIEGGCAAVAWGAFIGIQLSHSVPSPAPALAGQPSQSVPAVVGGAGNSVGGAIPPADLVGPHAVPLPDGVVVPPASTTTTTTPPAPSTTTPDTTVPPDPTTTVTTAPSSPSTTAPPPPTTSPPPPSTTPSQ